MITVDIDELNNIPDELLLELSGAVAGRYAAYLRIENTELKRQLAEREGWQLVPKEPTDPMKYFGEYEIEKSLSLKTQPTASGIYKAMLAAAGGHR